MNTKTFAMFVLMLGTWCLIVGSALVCLPLGFIVAGAALVAYALLAIDVEGGKS